MNSEPHAHQIEANDYGNFIAVSYGDQRTYVEAPGLHWPWESANARVAKRVKRAARKMIRRHDAESRNSRGDAILKALPPRLDPARWGSDQLAK